MFRRSVFLLSLAIVASSSAFAQATFDAQSSTSDILTSVANTTTFAHTTAVAQNRILLVAVHMNLRNAVGTTVTTVTYAGQPLTFLNAITDGGPDTRTEVWYQLNPATGANNVVVTAGGITPGENVESVSSATTFSNADQFVPPSAANVGQNDPAALNLAGTTTTDLIVSFISTRETVTLTADAPQIEGYDISTGGTNDDVQAAVGGRVGAAGSTTVSWDVSANRRWSLVAVNIRQARADVEVTQSALPDPVAPGGILTYTFYVQNNGPSTATGVVLTDTIPATTTFVGSSTTLGSCSGTSTVTCNLGTMTNGQTATITIQVTAPLTGGLIAPNTGTVTTTTTDPATPNTATATAYSLVQATVCGTQPGKDGAGGTLGGTINAYWPGTASAAVGATSITVGARRGAAVGITPGDLLLIIQMQDAAIDSNNDDRYGNGNGIVGGTTGVGAGYTNANNAGRHEYAIATNTIGAAGGALTFTAVGGANGLVYSYTNAAATGTQGQRRFQVVRVPQYTTATLGATLTAASWNGTTGGILALDVAGDLALGSATVSVNGLGFRGGAGLQLAGGAGSNNDYRNVAGNNTHGIKGEGIAGTPEDVLDGGVNVDVGPQGYPNGDYARGAPANGGGGGTDGNPAANDENSGGGGGANWGRGGNGGNTWNSNLARGGFGGAPFYDSPGRVVLGGGGGAGSRNNSSTIAGAGATGGGIVLIRAGRLTGTATITANGAAAYNDTLNDGGGGGGAGGAIVVLARGGGIGGLTLQANGGRGGDAWRTQAPGAYPGERHGPGGGGGGGYIAVNGSPAAVSVNGGASGITTTANDTFGAQPGAPGTAMLVASFDQITGVRSGCVDLSVAISDSPDPVIAGNDITYTQNVTNNSTVVPAQNVTLTQTTPPGTTFVSMTPPAGWSCTTPAVGGTGTITCTKSTPLAPSAGSGDFTLVVRTSPSLANGSTITQSVTTATSSPEPDTSNNTASATTDVIRRVDVAVTKVTNDPGSDNAFAQGDTLIYTIEVTNNGPSRASNVVMSDPLPAGFSFGSVNPGGPTCTQSGGTVTCTFATLDPGATNNITTTGTITVSTTQLSNTATVTRTETDTDASNDSATALANVLAPTVAHMMEMSAIQDPAGRVRVSWTTSFESENLGFNVYRVTANGRAKVNEHLIAGSALLTDGLELASGHAYRWNDTVRNGEFAQYYVEDVDLHGLRTEHGPVTPILVDRIPNEPRLETLAASSGAGGGVFVSPRGTGAPIRADVKPKKEHREQQWDLAGERAIKLMVTEEGWYRVPLSKLVAAGIDLSRDGLALFAEGVEQPIVVSRGAIEFYGIGIDTAASGARAYWLVSDKGRGDRIERVKTKIGKQVDTNTPFTFERIERTVFYAALTNNGDRENFFGAIVNSRGTTQELIVENPDRTRGNARLEITLQGVSLVAHSVAVTINGQSVGTMTFAGRERAVSTMVVPVAVLDSGANALKLTAIGGDADVSLVESVRLGYSHRLVADDDALKVFVAGGTPVSVRGFTSGDIHAIDVTDPNEPILLAVDASNGDASLVAPRSGTRSIIVLGEKRVRAPAAIVPNEPSDWNGRKNAADLVVITTAELTPAAERLARHRNGEGISTVIVDIEDVYDEFNFGERSPEAVRYFLERTRFWKREPRYVLLLGDASIDPRNYLGRGAFDLVPTKLIATAFMKTASDDWFADFKNQGIPQLAIGRLPARTPEEAETMIGRIVERDVTGYERLAFVTDGSFDAAATSLAALAPDSMPKSFAHAVASDTFESLLVTYIGHGSVGLWSTGSFTTGAAAQLTNGAKAPVVAAMTCLNGYYHDLFSPSLAEALLTNPNGGAVAVWASSTLTSAGAQMDLAREFFEQVFASATIGEAAARAKSATADADVRRSWILLGDPSMRLRSD